MILLLLLQAAFVFVVFLFLALACLIPVALVVCVAWDELVSHLRRIGEDAYSSTVELKELERLYLLEEELKH